MDEVMAAASTRRNRLLRRGVILEYATLAWNTTEIAFLGYAAVKARSVALAGFALDSFIEVFASIVVLWQLKGSESEERDRRAVRLIGMAFFGLAFYITAQSIVTLVTGVRPDASPLGIAWLTATTAAMFGLAYAKARTGRELGNSALMTESRVTLVDGTLAAAILLGLSLNAAVGWWWADIAAGFVLVGYGLREGLHALRNT